MITTKEMGVEVEVAAMEAEATEVAVVMEVEGMTDLIPCHTID